MQLYIYCQVISPMEKIQDMLLLAPEISPQCSFLLYNEIKDVNYLFQDNSANTWEEKAR